MDATGRKSPTFADIDSVTVQDFFLRLLEVYRSK